MLGDGKGGAFSLVAGDFEELYGSEGDEGKRGAWGAVVTCFFIDCVSLFFRILVVLTCLVTPYRLAMFSPIFGLYTTSLQMMGYGSTSVHYYGISRIHPRRLPKVKVRLN